MNANSVQDHKDRWKAGNNSRTAPGPTEKDLPWSIAEVVVSTWYLFPCIQRGYNFQARREQSATLAE
jgi:hypothetical protein